MSSGLNELFETISKHELSMTELIDKAAKYHYAGASDVSFTGGSIDTDLLVQIDKIAKIRTAGIAAKYLDALNSIKEDYINYTKEHNISRTAILHRGENVKKEPERATIDADCFASVKEVLVKPCNIGEDVLDKILSRAINFMFTKYGGLTRNMYPDKSAYSIWTNRSSKGTECTGFNSF